MVGPEAHQLALSAAPTYDSKLLEKKQPLYRLSQVTTQEDDKQTWEDWGNMWSFVYNNLQVPGSKVSGVDPTQHPVLIHNLFMHHDLFERNLLKCYLNNLMYQLFI